MKLPLWALGGSLVLFSACASPDQGFTISLRKDGARRVEERLVAMREDGSRAVRYSLPRSSGPGRREVIDVAEGVQVSIHPESRTKYTTHDLGWQPAPPDCAGPRRVLTASGETSEILGYSVSKFARSALMQDGSKLLYEEWRAPELGCVALRTVTAFRSTDGSVAVEGAEEAFAVVLGEPDPALFVIPEHYTEQGHALEAIRSAPRQWVRGED